MGRPHTSHTIEPPDDVETLRPWLDQVIAEELEARRVLFDSPLLHGIILAIAAIYLAALWSSWGEGFALGPRWPVTILMVALTVAEVSLFVVVRYLGGIHGRAWRVWSPIQSATLPPSLMALIYLGGTPLNIIWLWVIFVCIDIPQEPVQHRQDAISMIVSLLALVGAVAWRDGPTEALIYLLIGISAVFVMMPLMMSFRQRRLVAAQNLWLSEQLERAAVLRERERMQRDLHDGIAGSLSGLLARIRTVEGLDDTTRTQLEARGTELVAELRDLVWLHREERTWQAWLERLERALAALPHGHAELHVEVLGELPGTVVDASRGQHLAVCARELVFNALRHGAPSTVTVHIAFDPDAGISLSVDDDGHGFDTEQVERRGLANVARRARALGGELDVHSTTEGTRICLRAPL